MDMHTIFVLAALTTGVRVVAFDIADRRIDGTDDPGQGAEIVRGLIAEARAQGNGVVVEMGISLGGHYSAHSGLAGEVDAAIVFGGPVEDALSTDASMVQFGMDGIVGNALGFDHRPSAEELAATVSTFATSAVGSGHQRADAGSQRR